MELIGGIITFVAGVGIGYYFRHYIKRCFSKKNSTPTKEKDIITPPKNESRLKTDNGKDREEDDSPAAEEMRLHAKDFYGCFNALDALAQGKTQYRNATLGDWSQRMSNTERFPELSRYWSSLFDYAEQLPDEVCTANAKEFILFLKNCGICHDTAGDNVVIGKDTRLAYSGMDETNWAMGNSKIIRIPAWYLGETILEKGFLM